MGAWHAIASVHHMQEQVAGADKSTPDDVLQAAAKALAIYKELGNKKGEATALTTSAKAQIRQEKVSQGLKTAQESLDLWRELGQTRGMVKNLLNVCIHANKSI